MIGSSLRRQRLPIQRSSSRNRVPISKMSNSVNLHIDPTLSVLQVCKSFMNQWSTESLSVTKQGYIRVITTTIWNFRHASMSLLSYWILEQTFWLRCSNLLPAWICPRNSSLTLSCLVPLVVCLFILHITARNASRHSIVIKLVKRIIKPNIRLNALQRFQLHLRSCMLYRLKFTVVVIWETIARYSLNMKRE